MNKIKTHFAFIAAFALCICRLPAAAQISPNSFVITVNTANTGPGSSAADEYMLPALGFSYVNAYPVAYPDLSIHTSYRGLVKMKLPEPGIYKLEFPVDGGPNVRVFAGSTLTDPITYIQYTDNLKILSVEQWGTAKWTTMEYAFSNCANLKSNATDKPDLSLATSMKNMFAGATSFTGAVNMDSWNTSAVSDMSGMFFNATAFNQPIGHWNIGAVVNMQNMLTGSGMDCNNYGKTLTGWVQGATSNQTGVQLGAAGLSYGIKGKAAHDFLTGTKSWTVTGDTYNPNCVEIPDPSVTGVPGDITIKVWLNGSQAPTYVKRHYEITPTNDPENATGRVTLYFSNQDFKDFNSQTPAPALLLPDIDDPGTVEVRKANLLIEKRGGTSSDGSGLPGSYPGAVLTINPNNADIIWNSTANYWEVRFDVTGFSGFFVKTTSQSLPAGFGDLTAVFKNNQLHISWTTLFETSNSHFEIEASKGGKTFTKIGTVNSKVVGGHSDKLIDYHFNMDTAPAGTLLAVSVFVIGILFMSAGRNNKKKTIIEATLFLCLVSVVGITACQKNNDIPGAAGNEKVFIRIKQVDKDGKFEYSKTVQVVVD